ILPPSGRLHRPHPEGRKTRGAADPAADQVRAGHQSQDRQSAWHRGAADAPGARRRGDRMKRREFITLLGGAAAAWPLAARAQQTGRVWRVALIGAVSPLPAMLSTFREALQQRGWTEGKNLSVDVRWPKGSFAQEPGLISEVLHSNVDVIVAWSTPS